MPTTTIMNSWKDIEKYCNDRLQEIRTINEGHHCPSAFVCIAAFMGFLSRLAFGTNLAQAREDGVCFRAFVQKYMPQKYHVSPIPDLLYKTFRCGIVHAMSFDPEILESNRTVYLANNNGGTQGLPKLAIAHDTNLSGFCNGGQLQTHHQPGMYVLVADVLCDDLSSAIKKMFQDPAVQNNSEEFVRVQRPIQEIGKLLSQGANGVCSNLAYQNDVVHDNSLSSSIWPLTGDDNTYT